MQVKLNEHLDTLNDMKKEMIEKHFDENKAKKAKAVLQEKADLTAAGKKLKKLWGWDN